VCVCAGVYHIHLPAAANSVARRRESRNRNVGKARPNALDLSAALARHTFSKVLYIDLLYYILKSTLKCSTSQKSSTGPKSPLQ